MDEIDRIERALATNRLDAQEFEDCAADLLSVVYPGISPIKGGTDWGRDADIHGEEPGPALRLLVTTSRTLTGVRANMAKGLKSMAKHSVAAQQIVLANPALLSQLDRNSLAGSAGKYGVQIAAFYDRRFFVSRLRRDGAWRHRVLGLPAEPFSLSAIPADLAESPWVSVPFTRRGSELEQLQQAGGDVVVSGSPGVGKTRLVAELPGIAFADPHAGLGRVCDDIRAAQPDVVALDDSGQHLELLRGLVRLRRAERDLLKFRIIAICWPDEAADIKAALGPSAHLVDVGRLDDRAIDEIATGMGATSLIARNQIIDQADGRPGWAVPLAGAFTRQQDWASLFAGDVLLDQVLQPLRRAGANASTADLLALVSVLGSASWKELPQLRTVLEVSQPTVQQALTGAAHAGLIDVTRGPSERRVYRVRPQMLADVLAADRVFRAAVPPFSLNDLADRWPERTAQLAWAAIGCARVGAESARTTADELVRRCREAGTARGLLTAYALLDERAGRQVVAWLREDLSRFQDAGRITGAAFDAETDTAAQIASTHLSPGAVDLLLDAALIHAGPTNRATHPISRLEESVRRFHPELRSTSEDLRRLVAARLDAWIGRHRDEPAAWRTYNGVLAAVMTLHRRAVLNLAAEPDRFSLHERIADPAHIQAIYAEVWPTILSRLRQAPPATIRAAVDITAEWLRIGAGHDRPFGKPHPEPALAAAKQAGTAMLRELKPLTEQHIGLTDALADTSDRYGVELDASRSAEGAAFLARIDHKNFEGSVTALRTAIGDQVATWDHNQPRAVAQRLNELKQALALATVNWPDRIEIACEHLAQDGTRLAEWITAALDFDLFPSAAPFLERLLAADEHLDDALFDRLLTSPQARAAAQSAVLLNGRTEDRVAQVIADLNQDDDRTLAWLVGRGLSPARRALILTTAEDGVRGAFALALFTMHTGSEAWPSAEIARPWAAAIEHLEFEPDTAERIWAYDRLLDRLIDSEPAIVGRYAERELRRLIDSRSVPGLRTVTRVLFRLPSEMKTAVLSNPDYSKARTHLIGWLIGDDEDWTREMLGRGTLSPEDVLGAISGLEDRSLSTEQLAELLVPLGADPAQIAEQAAFGMFSGEESDHYAALAERFSQMAASEQAATALVGREGTRLFMRLREQARVSESAR